MMKQQIIDKIVLVGCDQAALESLGSTLSSYLAVQLVSFSQVDESCNWQADIVGYVMSDMGPNHLHNISQVRSRVGCKQLFVFTAHLSIPLLCQLLRTQVTDAMLTPCMPSELLRLTSHLSEHSQVTCHLDHDQLPVLTEAFSDVSQHSLHEVLQTVEHNFERKLSQQTIAKQLNMSPSRLSHMFKDLCGIGFCHYLVCRRLEEAELMLAQSKANITAVAFELGFANPSHFCRAFKEHLGITPTAYLGGERHVSLSPLYQRYLNLRAEILPAITMAARRQALAQRAHLRVAN